MFVGGFHGSQLKSAGTTRKGSTGSPKLNPLPTGGATLNYDDIAQPASEYALYTLS